MRLFVGTSGFAYKEWKGSFYPADLKADGMLSYYGDRFRTVEINNTFYRMPSEKVLRNWAEQVPEDFRFVLKASQKITHFKRLKETEGELEYFLRTSQVLGARRGPTLFQLPPNLKLDLPRLEVFLATVPKGWPAAFEFRHPSWYTDAVFDALRGRNMALCVADESDRPGTLVATASYGYLRLRREEYSKEALAAWVAEVQAQSWEEAFVFFKHEDAGAGPALAAAFEAQWAA